MRTTLSLDKDIAAAIARLRKTREILAGMLTPPGVQANLVHDATSRRSPSSTA
jgi:hypothetical protein